MNALRRIYNEVHAMKKILFIDDLFLTGIVIKERIQQTNYLNYSNNSTDLEEEDYSSNDFYDSNKILNKSDLKAGNKDFQILDWSVFYNYRWQAFKNEFIKTLAQKENCFNSIWFINDLDKMPNRTELVKNAWKNIKNCYQVH